MAEQPGHVCVDCVADPPKTVRPVVNPAARKPRCATHLKSETTRRRKQSRARQVERTYGISDEDNHELFLLQGGRCWLCQKATGATKSLAVDHDHVTCEVRGRLCGPCNQFIGKLGDDPEAARRLVGYLSGDTPYRRMKAARTLTAAGYQVRALHSVIEIGGELYANWMPAGDDIWYRTGVRRADGTWSVTRD